MNGEKLFKRMTAAFLVTLSLSILPSSNSNLVVARNTYTYNPPKQPKQPKQPKKVPKSRSASSGSRGCNNPSLFNAKARLFAPEDHVGLTISSHPSFFWYIETDSEVKVRFTLIDPGVAEPIIDLQQTVSTSGLGKLKLPSELPELKPGKLYRWTVALICNPKRPSQNSYAYSFIERVPLPDNLSQHLKVRNTERASIYAQAGIWYDAVTEAYLSNSNHQQFISLVTQFNQSNQN